MEEDLRTPGTVEVELGTFGLIPGPKGDTGERGPRGYGIESAVLNQDFTLTVTFENGESYTTPAIRGQDGIGVKEVRLTPGAYGEKNYADKLTVELTDGKVFDFELFNRAAEFFDKAEAAKDAAEDARSGSETARDEAVGAAGTAAEDAVRQIEAAFEEIGKEEVEAMW